MVFSPSSVPVKLQSLRVQRHRYRGQASEKLSSERHHIAQEYLLLMGSENTSLAISVGDGRRSMASVASMAPSGAEGSYK